jgi:hypothetical protein
MQLDRWRSGIGAACAFLLGLGILDLGGIGPVAVRAQQGDGCDPLGSCTCPLDRPGGLTHDGTYLWVGSYNVGVAVLACIDPRTCEVVRTIPAPGRYIGGLAWDGAALWCLPEESGLIQRIDPVDGTVLSSIPAPSYGARNPAGADLAWDGTSLWHVDYATDLLYRLDPATGEVQSSFPTPGALPAGLGWFQGTLVMADASLDRVLLIDPSDGSVLKSCPAGDTFPWGACVAPSGEVFVTGINSDQIRALDVGFETSFYSSYCRSNPNSTGAAGILSATGSASLAAGDLELVASNLPRGVALFFYGSDQVERPFRCGVLCVGGRLSRFGVARVRAGEARAALGDVHGRRCSALEPGSTWNFQALYLDGGLRRRRGLVNLTDAITIRFEP